MVPRAGIEPALPKKQDFKSCVSTNSTIQAGLCRLDINVSTNILYYIIQCFLKVLNPFADTLILKTKPVSGSLIFL